MGFLYQPGGFVMAIELSSLTFTNKSDVVPDFGVEEIINTGLANTLSGKDSMLGSGILRGLTNDSGGTIDTGACKDSLFGTASGSGGFTGIGIENKGTINTGTGKDSISGSGTEPFTYGILNGLNSIINTGVGNDSIIGSGGFAGIQNGGIINMGVGNDSITAIATDFYSVSFTPFLPGIEWEGIVNTHTDTLKITEWNSQPNSNFWTPESIPLELSAVTSNGDPFDIPNQWDGNIGDDWAFISKTSNFDLSWLEGSPDPFFKEVFFGWTGAFQQGNFFKSQSLSLVSVQSSSTIALSAGDGQLEVSRNPTLTFTDSLINGGIIDTGTGKDSISAIGGYRGIYNTRNATIKTGTGNDTVDGSATEWGIYNDGIINTGSGKDSITGSASDSDSLGIENKDGIINTGNGKDSITGTGGFIGILNFAPFTFSAAIDTGNGNDFILGSGNIGISNYASINTGNGKDIITGTSNNNVGIQNQDDGIINTGNGNDKIIGSGNVGIFNKGTIDTAKDNDIIDATNGGFLGDGNILLGDGNDILKGFGSGIFNGGNGKDKLELTTGSYTVGISVAAVSFTSHGITMNTSEFEQLIAGSIAYDFTQLFNGQIITIA